MPQTPKNPSDAKSCLDDFYDAEISVHELLDTERYIDHQLIDKGASKEVFRVYDTHCSREVAFAKIRKGVFSLENAIDFVREVQITSSFEHPNIIRIYDVGITDELPWFTMELSSGKTLTHLIEETPELPLAERLETFVQLCDAVSYAHERNVLHLDLKPDNVSIDKRGQVLLADWGLASSIQKHPEADLMKAQDQPGMIKGSLGYMAPEQAAGDYTEAPAADIFGLGAMLYFLLTGEPPVAGQGLEDILKNSQEGRLKTFERPEIPPRLIPLLTKILAKSPTDRYSSVTNLKREIEAYRDGFATLVEDASVMTQLRLFCRRNKALCFTVLFAFIALIISTAYYIESIKQSEALAVAASIEAVTQRQEADDQRIVAEAQRLEADIQRALAEDALAKFLTADALQKQTEKELSLSLFDHARSQLSAFDFKTALKLAQEAVEHNPKSQDALRRLGVIHFIRQDFKNAEYYLSNYKGGRRNHLLKIADQFKDSTAPMQLNDFLSILDQVPNREYLRLCMLKYDARIRPPKGHSLVLAQMLKERNHLDSIQLHYHTRSKVLNLSGNPGLKTVYAAKTAYSPAFNLLESLPIRKLILDDTTFNRTNQARFQPNLKCKIEFR